MTRWISVFSARIVWRIRHYPEAVAKILRLPDQALSSPTNSSTPGRCDYGFLSCLDMTATLTLPFLI